MCRVYMREVTPPAMDVFRGMDALASGSVFEQLGPAPLPLIPADECDTGSMTWDTLVPFVP